MKVKEKQEEETMKKNIKKLLLLIAVIATLVLCLAVSASALSSSGSCGKNVTYTYNSTTKELVISGTGAMYDYDNSNYNESPFYNSDIKSVVINDGVTSIGDVAFSCCESLKSITIPDSVTSIGDYAFIGCTSLKSITIPDSVTSIGRNAFYDTAYYNNSSNWENDVLYIDKHFIKAKTSISGAYEIKSGTKTIADSAFEDCTSLKSITIPDSVTSIGYYAFYRCTSLESITIPDSVTTIDDGAFNNCSSLKNVYASDIESWLKISFSGYASNPMCNEANLYFGNELVKEIVIPDGISAIKDYAFRGCTSLESITIPDSVTLIGDEAFYNCTALSSITIPDSVTSIGDYAFIGCTSLKSITIPDSVTSIGRNAFYDTAYYNNSSNWENDVLYIDKHFIKAKTSISGAYEIKSETKTIAGSAFSQCTSLESITIPDSVTSIGTYAFSGCTSLTSITIPDSVTSIGDYAFYYCESLKSITIPDSVTSIGYKAFYCCESLDDVYYYGTREQWTNINIDLGNDALTDATIHYNNCENHDIISHEAKSATCTEKGWNAYVACSKCSYTTYKEIPAKGHSFTEKIINAKYLKTKATVEKAAVYKYVCSVCGAVSSDKTFSYGKPLSLGVTSKVSATQNTSAIKLTWNKAENASGYRIYYKLPGDISWRSATAYTTATTQTYSNLPSGQKYTFAIRSAYKKTDGTYILGGYKTIETATEAVKPSKVISAQNTSAIRLTWTACKGADGYRIYYKSGSSWKVCLSTTSLTTHTFTKLNAGAKYTFAVRPYIKIGSTVIWSDYTQFTTATTPAAVTAKASSTASGRVSLSWNAVNGADGYQVYYKVGNGSYKLYKTYGDVKTLTFSGLKSGTQYTFAVRAGIKTSGGNIFGGYKTATVTVR